MAIAGGGSVLHYLRRLLRPASADGQSDGPLVGQLVAARDEAAFTELLRRHGPMVWGVCRRVLGDSPDAEDAFQATFLVLLRKAASVRRRASVRSWLYGVAARVAVRARCAARRRGERERPLQQEPAQPESAAALECDLRAVLDEELARLPPKYREPLVLTLLEGKTHEEAARELACPKGTVSVRVMRGRERLRGRLARRGLSVPAGALAAAGLAASAQAAVPPAVAAVAVRSTVAFLSGAAAGGVSPRVIALTKGVLTTMLLTKVRTAVLVLLAVVATGLVLATAYGLGATEQDRPGGGQGAKQEAPAAGAKAREEEAALKKALVEEARKVYQLDMARLKNLQGVSAEELYRWSRRLLEAQLDLAAKPEERLPAFREHLKRMQEVEGFTDRQWKVGQGRESEAVAGRYYRSQAALWLARELKK
jgi:RNA polymerase sigma factor (sigma-70 family)